MIRRRRLLLAALALLALAAPAPAGAASCAQLFAGGQAPILLNPKLARRTTLLCNDAYAALASGITRGPLWSAERLTAGRLAAAEETARDGRFHADPRLPSGGRAELADYVRSGYDRGHMTPSGDMPDQQAQEQSFSLANVVPQTAELNRGVWEKIESAVRRLAEREGQLYVVSGPAFQGAKLQSIGPEGVLVPSSTWKAVYDPRAGGAGAYLCRNVREPTCVTLSVSRLAQVTGIDPFPALPARVKATAMTLPTAGESRSMRRGHHERHAPSLLQRILRWGRHL